MAGRSEQLGRPKQVAEGITRGVSERVQVRNRGGHQGGHAQNVQECGAVCAQICTETRKCPGDTFGDRHHLCRVHRRSAPGQTHFGLPDGAGGRVLALRPAELHPFSRPAGSRGEGDTAATWELRKRSTSHRAPKGSMGLAIRCCSRLADRPPRRGGAHAAKRGAEIVRRRAWKRTSSGRRKHYPFPSHITPSSPNSPQVRCSSPLRGSHLHGGERRVSHPPPPLPRANSATPPRARLADPPYEFRPPNSHHAPTLMVGPDGFWRCEAKHPA